MAYMCKLMNKECDACGVCQEDPPECPVCGETCYEETYHMGREWIGCSECVERRMLL